MSQSVRRPPRLAEHLLSGVLPSDDAGDSIRGDLHQEFLEGGRLAALQYWLSALRITLRYGGARLARRPGVPPVTASAPRLWLPSRSDLLQTIRGLRRKPAMAVASIVTVALGIGTNTVVFTLVNTILLSPLPYPNSQELVRLWPSRQLSLEVLDTIRERSHSFVELAGVAPTRLSFFESAEPLRLTGAAVTTGYLSMLGATPVLGRGLLPEDHATGAPPVVILSAAMWRTHYGSATDVIGRQLGFGNSSSTIVGVLSAEFRPLLDGAQFWVPLQVPRSSPVYAGRTWLTTVGRLRGSTSAELAQLELQRVARRVVADNPTTYGDDWVRAARILSLQDSLVNGARPLLWALQGAVLFVFLIACSNMTNLMLAATASRHRELAMRRALGAANWRLIKLVLTQSLLLALAGGVVGALMADWTVTALKASPHTSLPLIEKASLGNAVWIFTLGLSLAGGLLFAVGPCWLACRNRPEVLRGARGDAGGSVSKWSGSLVTVEVAMTLVLVAGAGLMLKSVYRLGLVDPGFQPEPVVALRLTLSSAQHAGGPAYVRFFEEVQRRVGGLPGVASVGGIHQLPLAGSSFNFTYVTPDHPEDADRPRRTASVRLLLPGYFESMGIPVLAGRGFSAADRADSDPVGIINRQLANQLWPRQDPVGKRIHFFDAQTPAFQIVGVVENVRQIGLDQEAVPEIYRPLSQYPWSSLYLTVKASRSTAGLIPQIRGAIWSFEKTTVISEAETLAEVVSNSFADRRLYATLLSAIALLAAVLGGIGIYGVMACNISRRLHEIGVRMALGADAMTVLATTLARGLRPVVLGLGAGLIFSVVSTRALSRLLYDVEPVDGAVFAVGTLGVLAVALVAVLAPCRRATAVEPASVLRVLSS